jgi:hypothetical protein
LLWRPEEVQMAESLKQSPITAAVLAFPSLEKLFHLFVNVNKGTALRVLTQENGEGKNKNPVAYLSNLIDRLKVKNVSKLWLPQPC